MRPRRGILGAIVAIGIALNGAWPPPAQAVAPQLDFSTYFGGSSTESVTAVRVDSAGNIYLAGSTRSRDLPVTANLFSPPPTSEWGFLLKLRVDRSIVYSTYLERPVVALAVDSRGNAIVGDNLPAGNRFSGPLGDAVLTKIDASGSQVMYSVRLAGNRSDQVNAIEVDTTDSLVVVGQTNSPDFPLVNPLQSTVPSGAAPGTANAFITKLDPDGRLVFSTGWGGNADDAASAIAIDRNLDIVVAGTTLSSDFFTTPNAFQRNFVTATCSGGCGLRRDAFVLRVSGDGQTVRYSTLFGGTNDEDVTALALDRVGSSHITGVTRSADLPLKNALQTTCDSTFEGNGCSTYVTKLTPDGSALQYSTYFGSRSYYIGNLGRLINALAVDPDGNLVAAGWTEGSDLPVWDAVQTMNGSGPLFKSTDDGASWIPSSAGISGTGVWSITGAGRPQVFYANPLGGNLFRSDDEGASWRARPSVGNIAVDPLTPAVLYAASTSGAFRSTDGGENWSRLPLDETSLVNVAIAPASPQNVYMSSNRGIFHTANGGLTWSRVLETAGNFTQPYVHFLAVDPQNADAVYASLSDGSVVRRDGGQQWTQLARLECPGNQLVFASGQPASIYARACGKVFKSIDRGGSWREVGFSSRTAAWIALDPLNANVLYVASAQNGVYRSRDGGETWTRIREPLEQDVRAIWVDRAGAIYIGATGASNGFITQFNSSGTVMLSTYLGGMGAATMRIAIDQAGTIVVGGNAGNGFPLVRPIQGSYRGAGDAFVARLVERR